MTKPKTPTVLLISSTVAASRVGATAAGFCLRRLGVETVVLPTTVMGRHPGWGAPGGGRVSGDILRDVWAGVRAQNLTFDAVLSGYMGGHDHIDLSADIIAHVKTDNPTAKIVVDPVMGDHGRLYIPEARAKAIRDILVPLADTITPNLWELEYLTGTTDIAAACRSFPSVLVTSVPDGEDKIGAQFHQGGAAWQVSHPKFASVPHGGGDSLAALFLGRRLLGETPKSALANSVASVFEIMRAANRLDTGELPLIRMQAFINDAIPLVIRP